MNSEEGQVTRSNGTRFKTAEVKEVVIVTTLEGDGGETPVRGVTWIYAKDGSLIAWSDPVGDKTRALIPGGPLS